MAPSLDVFPMTVCPDVNAPRRDIHPPTRPQAIQRQLSELEARLKQSELEGVREKAAATDKLKVQQRESEARENSAKKEGQISLLLSLQCFICPSSRHSSFPKHLPAPHSVPSPCTLILDYSTIRADSLAHASRSHTGLALAATEAREATERSLIADKRALETKLKEARQQVKQLVAKSKEVQQDLAGACSLAVVYVRRNKPTAPPFPCPSLHATLFLSTLPHHPLHVPLSMTRFACPPLHVTISSSTYHTILQYLPVLITRSVSPFPHPLSTSRSLPFLPYHPPTPLYPNTLPYPPPIPLSHTALPYHSSIPLFHTTLPYHSPIPLSPTTLPSLPPIPPSHTTLTIIHPSILLCYFPCA